MIDMINNRQLINFEKADTEAHAYVLGFIAADGCLTITKTKIYRIEIELSDKDLTHLWKLNEILTGGKNKIYRNKKGGFGMGRKYSRLVVTSKVMFHQLLEFGLSPRKTFTLEPPKLRPHLIAHWIRGYFDGDGCLTQNKTRHGKWVPLIKVIGTKSVVEFIRSFLSARGISSSIQKKGKMFELVCRGHQSIAMMRLMYKNASLFLDRKLVKAEGWM
jgi:intein-encoded DNA endonuclease-like protein